MNKYILCWLLCVWAVVGKAQKNWTVERLDAQILKLNELEEKGEYQTALKEAQPLAQALKAGPKMVADSTYLEAIEAVGNSYYNVGDYAEATYFYTLMAEASAHINKGNNKHQAAALNNLAIIYSDEGDMKKGLDYALKSMAIEEVLHGRANADYVVSLNNIALLYKELGKIDSAEAMLLEGVELSKISGDTAKDNYISLLNNLASLYSDKRDFESGKYLIEQALPLSIRFWGEDHPETARLYTELGYYHNKCDNIGYAERCFKKGIALMKSKAGTESTHYMTALAGMAMFYLENHKYDEALAYYEESLALERKYNPTQLMRIGDVLARMGQAYLSKGEGAKAKRCFLEALALFGQNKDKSFLYTLETHNFLADYAAHWEPELFEKHLSTAINMNCGLDLSGKLDVARDLPKIAASRSLVLTELVLSLGHWAENLEETQPENAYTIAKTTLKLINEAFEVQTNESSKLNLLERYSVWTNRALKYGVAVYEKSPSEALLLELEQLAEGNKAKLLLRATQNAQKQQFGDLPPQLADSLHGLQARYERLRAAESSADSRVEQQEINAKLNKTTLAIKELNKYISEQYPRYAQSQENQQVPVQKLQKLLPLQTAMLLYHNNGRNLICFYIDAQNLRMHKLNKDSLNLQIEALRTALTDYASIANDGEAAYRNYVAPAHWLYRRIVAPLEIGAEIKHLIIVPDGGLAHLPFETFLEAQPDARLPYAELQYLLKKYRISYSYSATLWADNVARPLKSNNGQILAMAADYTFKASQNPKRNAAATKLRRALAPLPQVENEVMSLKAIFKGQFIHGEAANEANFKQLAPEFDIIHLAMHGVLNPNEPILSSLAFTEDGHPKEDNFLQAYEISQLKLNANLIVLSACETGYGRFAHGEGSLSLARAFMYAGASSLLVSMWPVNDGATSMLMSNYYKHLHAGLDKAEALQAAKLEYLQQMPGDGSHPAFWAPFVQLGDTRPLKKKSYIWYYFAAAIAAVSSLAYTAIRKRQAR